MEAELFLQTSIAPRIELKAYIARFVESRKAVEYTNVTKPRWELVGGIKIQPFSLKENFGRQHAQYILQKKQKLKHVVNGGSPWYPVQYHCISLHFLFVKHSLKLFFYYKFRSECLRNKQWTIRKPSRAAAEKNRLDISSPKLLRQYGTHQYALCTSLMSTYGFCTCFIPFNLSHTKTSQHLKETEGSKQQITSLIFSKAFDSPLFF